jgi:hypothetical protein
MSEYPEDYEPIPAPRPEWYREDIRRSLFNEEGQPEDWFDIPDETEPAPPLTKEEEEQGHLYELEQLRYLFGLEQYP